MRRTKKFLAVFLATITLISVIKLCGGGGDVHPIGNVSIQQIK